MSTATLHYIHDPLCGWCYAAQPLVGAALAQLGGRLALRLYGGGLFGEPHQVDAGLVRHIVHSGERIAQLSGQPFGEAYRQGELAEEIGLDGARFASAFGATDGHAVFEHVQASRRLLDEFGGRGFPTLLLETGGRHALLPHHHHYGRPDAFVQTLAAQLPALH
ncbi:hypothetical protein [Rhodanobacter geophilus]|uniref:DsbA family protein n=1 Tax=Rhodanobacter geophilus TaxID=3162488 RepID=A0ABV3QU05_9GAMM